MRVTRRSVCRRYLACVRAILANGDSAHSAHSVDNDTFSTLSHAAFAARLGGYGMSGEDTATQPNEPAITDCSLLQQIAELQDRKALACLYRRHGATLHALAFGIVFDSVEANRAVARAMREAWRTARSEERRVGKECRSRWS